VKIMALRFLTADGFGGIEYAIQALNYAMDMKARGVNIRVTSNSWGGSDYSQAMDQAIRRSADAGMLFVAAAGNGDSVKHVGFDIDAPGAAFYPASHDAPSVISVAATDSKDLLATFSNFGASGVDLAAPGVNVVSTIRNGSYAYLSGTSMATPLVSGVAAMAFTLKPAATWQEVRDAIFAGVDRLPGLAGKTATGGRLNAANTLRHLLPTAVVGRHVFYNNSAFDGRSAAASPGDDNAIAADKAALLRGAGPATFANYTSYSKGINGVMVDVRNLPAGDLTADDFAFNLGTDSDLLASWQPAPTPRAVSVRRGEGVDGSDRVTLTFADGAIKNTWLRVTVLANDHTGLAAPDVFYFGNAVGETGDSAADAAVNLFDVVAVRSHLFAGATPATNRFDLDRDGRVNSMDLVIALRARTDPALPLIILPEL
jgi:subtilisin family serine protease